MITLFVFRKDMRGTQYGIGTYIQQLSLSLLKHTDITIYLVNYYSLAHTEFTLKSEDSRLHEINIPIPKTGYGNKKQIQKYASRIIDLLTDLINYELNIIFLVNYPDALPIVQQLKLRFTFPVVSVVHSAQWHFIFDGNKKAFIKAWINKMNNNSDKLKPIIEEKELYELSDKIISVTNYMKNFIMKYYHISEEKTEVIHNGIDSNIFYIPKKEEKAALKQKLGFGKYEKIVLFSGRLDSSKGIYSLIDSFSEVIKQHNNIRLVLIGEDSGPDKICQYLAHCNNIWSKITFTGFLKYEEVLKFYQIADVGIIPSIYDHCPYVALEMIGHNIPLVISDTEGLNEILAESQSLYIKPFTNKNGYLNFRPDDISDAILSLIKSHSTAKRISKDYNHLIRTKYSAKLMAGKLYSVLNKLVAVQ